MKLTRPTAVLAFGLACLTVHAQAQQSADVHDPSDKTPPTVQAPAPAAVRQTVPINPAAGLFMSITPGSSVPQVDALLHDNGAVANSPGTGPGGADESILQTALGHTTFGFTAATSSNFVLADDFTISDPTGWDIDEVDFYAYQTGSTTTSSFNDIRIAIYSDMPGGTLVFGDLTTNRLAATSWSNCYRRVDTVPGGTTRPVMRVTGTVGTNLPAGHYWIAFQAGGTLASGPFGPPLEPLGVPSSGNAQQGNKTTNVYAGILNGTTDTCDLPFQIRGEVRPPPCTPGGPYLHDDGTAENSVGLTAGGDLVWMNIFDACMGTDKLECVSVAFGTPQFPGNGALLGSTFNVVVWDDPNDDGNPADGVLIAGPVKGTVTAVDSDTFIAVAIPSTAVVGKFIVGVYLTHAAGLFPGALDQGQSSGGRSWVTGSSTPGSYNPAMVAGSIGLFDMDLIGLPGVWLVRANDNCPPPPPPCLPGAIATLFTSNNGGSAGGGVYFNLNVANPAGITVESIDVNTSATVGSAITMNVWVVAGGFNGKETNMGLWTNVSSGGGTSGGSNVASNVDVTDFALAPGLWGVAYAGNFAHRYTNGTGTNQNFFSADCDISAGKASNVAFTAPLFNPRVVNTRIHYCADPGTGTNYCRPTKTNRGCLPHTVSSGKASATGVPGSFTVGCVDVPSKKNGFQILSFTGAQAVPFGAGTLCLQTPIFRLSIQNSGGTGICDGKYSDDMGAIIAANPGLFPPGQSVFCQYLFRESSLPMAQGLSDGHRYVVGP